MISNSLRTFPLFSSMKEEAKSLTNFPLLSNICCCCWCSVISVVSDFVRPHRWQPTRICHPWDSPGKNTGVGCHCLLPTTATQPQIWEAHEGLSLASLSLLTFLIFRGERKSPLKKIYYGACNLQVENLELSNIQLAKIKLSFPGWYSFIGKI